jgi:hypothetical protein
MLGRRVVEAVPGGPVVQLLCARGLVDRFTTDQPEAFVGTPCSSVWALRKL